MTLPASPSLSLSAEVAAALQAGQPLVALESTIIAHGMPYPQNLETARAVEAIVREEGAVPATVALLGGKVQVGLDAAACEHLASSPGIQKASRRDLAFYLSQGIDAATTVAATMIGAHMAGIGIFATGGIGGVHRGAAETFDISADLQELARTPVAVVSAGAKSILDLGLTLEYLETQGVPVVGYGTDEFPAFYCRESGLKVPHRLDSPEAVARLLATQQALGLGGVLVANPIPTEHALPPALVEEAIAAALAEASGQGIAGKALTPFLLARIKQLTEGESLFSNIQLVYHNARLAAQIARARKALG